MPGTPVRDDGMSLATVQGVPGKFDLGVLKAVQEDTSGILATVTAD